MFSHRVRSRCRFAAKVVLIGVLALLLARNWIAVQLVQLVGSRLLERQIRVGRIDLGFHDITVTSLCVEDEPDSARPLVSVEHITARLSLFRGLRDGVWADSVLVDAPIISLRFAADGTLLTRLPQAQSSDAPTNISIPVRLLVVRGAGLVVSQTDRQPLEIADVTLNLVATDEIRLQTQVPDLLGATIEIRSTLNAKTFAGETRLLVSAFHVDSSSLARLALAPEALAKFGVSADASLAAFIRHPPNDLNPLHHQASVTASLSNVISEHAGTLLASMKATAEHDGDETKFNLDAHALGGEIAFDGRADVRQLPVQVDWTTSGRGCDLQRVVKHLKPSLAAGTIVAWHGDGSGSFDGKSISIETAIEATASNLFFSAEPTGPNPTQTVRCELASATIEAHGTTRLDDPTRISGLVTGRVHCPEFLLAPLAKIAPLADVKQLNDLDGKVSLIATFTSPLDPAIIASECVASAHMTTAGVKASGMRLRDADLTLDIADGVITGSTGDLAVLHGPSGNVVATANATGESKVLASNPLASPLTTRLAAAIPSLPMLLELAGQSSNGFAGSVSATASSLIVLDQLTNVDAWQADASLASHSVHAAGEALQDVVIAAHLQNGQLSLPETSLHWRDTECRFAALGDLSESVRLGRVTLDGAFSVAPISIAELATVASRYSQTRLPATGMAVAGGDFHLATAPLTIRAEGIAKLSDATYAGRSLGQATLNWKFNDEALLLTSQSPRFFGGTYTATATMHDLDWSLAQINAQFSDVRVSKLAAFIPSDLIAAGKLPITGTVNGGAHFTSLADLTALTGNVWFSTDSMTVHDLPIEVKRCSLDVDAGRLKAICTGTVAEGKLNASASSTIASLVAFATQAKLKLADLPVIVDVRLDNVSIQRLVSAAGVDRRTLPVQATANVAIVRDAATRGDGAMCDVVASIEDVRWNRNRLSPLITATLLVEPERIVLRSLDGQFADGRVSGSGEARLSSPLDGSFEFAASRVNLRRATAPFGGTAARVSGSGDVSVRGRLGRTISGDARIAADHVSVAGLGVPRVRIPLSWSYTLDSHTARWRCRGGVVEAGNGEVRIATDGSFSRQLDMNFTANVSHVDTSRLLVGKSVGAGIVDGQVSLQAKRARSLKQLSGSFDLELSQIQALQIPVLSELPQVINLPSVASLTSGPSSDGGTIHGRLSGAVIHIDQIALQQSNVQVLVDGTSTMDGRLDLNLTASTGSTSPTEGLISVLDSPLMLAAPAPVALIAKANEAMKDRVINVHVGGTATRPTMKIQPGKALTQDAIRYFLSGSFGSRIADAATTSRNQRRR